MGFRSTFVTQHNYLPIPEWFFEKYKEYFNFNHGKEDHSLPLSSRFEFKTYFPTAEEFPKDIQKIMRETAEDISDQLVFVWLHECGGITRVQIDKENILFSEPSGWEETTGVTHDYCYGCSDVKH